MALWAIEARPVGYGAAHLFPCAGDTKDRQILETWPDDLQADRDSGGCHPAMDRGGGLLAHVPGNRECDMLEIALRVICRGGKFCRITAIRIDRRDDRVQPVQSLVGGAAHGENLLET